MTSQIRFEDLTETTGIPLSAEGASMMATRYSWAAGFCEGKRVLELGAGSGQGWRMFREAAESVIPADYSLALLKQGKLHFGGSFEAVALSADFLPFPSASFDVVVFFEALYYVPDPLRALAEIVRLLKPGGVALFASANPQRSDFIPSPHSVRYLTADEMRGALERLGLQVEILAGFPIEERAESIASTIRSKAFAGIRIVATSLGLIPKTLRGRARLKKLVYGRLTVVPPELSREFAPTEPMTEVPAGPIRAHKVFYCIGRRDDLP
jgi:ubiquinone/menaquinone biosynthesis C-methylase UbiE